MIEDLKCIICGSWMDASATDNEDVTHYQCPVCGIECYKRDVHASEAAYKRALSDRVNLNKWREIYLN